MIRIYCSKADATLQETETLTAGMVNTPVVQFTFSSDWDGLGKSAIVRAGTVIKEVVVSNNQIVVPSECLAKAGVNLIIGVWGGNFTTELPTVWCACGEIQDATNPYSALNHEEGTASNVAQMLAAAERAEAALDQIENANWDDVAQKVGAEKVNKPTSSPNGVAGQILKTNGDGSTQWINPMDVFGEDIDSAVFEWLDEHPEATTTVQDNSLSTAKYQDGSITYDKLNDDVKKKLSQGSVTPQMYGAVGDGITDDTEAFTAMAEAVNGDEGIHEIIIPEGTYLLKDSVEISKDCSIVGYGAELIFDGDFGLYISGSFEVVGKTTTPADIGATTLATNYTVPISANSEYLIYDTTGQSWSSERDYYRRGEFLKVAENNGGVLYLTRALADAYVSNCRIIKVDPVTSSIEGLKVSSLNSTTAHVGNVSIIFGKNCIVKNCKFEGSPHLQISLNNCCDSKIENCSGVSVSVSNEGMNYGVSILSCDNIIVSDCTFITQRHGFTIGNGKYPFPARYIEFLRCKAIAYNHVLSEINGTAHLDGATAFDAHANSEFITWRDCMGDSIGNDASNCTLEGCTFKAIGTYCPIYGWYQVRGYYKIKNCRIYGWNGTTSVYYNCRSRRADIDPDFNLIIENSYIEKTIDITFETSVAYKKWVDVIHSTLPEGIKVARAFPKGKVMLLDNDAGFLDFALSYGGDHVVCNNRCGYICTAGGSASYRVSAYINGNFIFKHSNAKAPISTEHSHKAIVTDNIVDLTLVSNVTGIIQAVDSTFLIATQNIFVITKDGNSITVENIDHRTPGTALKATDNIWYIDGSLVDYTPS